MTTDDTDPPLRSALDALLSGSQALIREAFAAMPAAEVAALNSAVDAGTCQISVTMILPSGAVRVGVAGDWPQDRKTLWELLPAQDVLQRPLSA